MRSCIAYIRRLNSREKVKASGIVTYKGFECADGDLGMSVHGLADKLTQDHCQAYRERYKEVKGGKTRWPAICAITHQQFTEDPVIAMTPKHSDDSEEDPEFGDLHHDLIPCLDPDIPDQRSKMERMAFWARENYLIAPYEGDGVKIPDKVPPGTKDARPYAFRREYANWPQASAS